MQVYNCIHVWKELSSLNIDVTFALYEFVWKLMSIMFFHITLVVTSLFAPSDDIARQPLYYYSRGLEGFQPHCLWLAFRRVDK